MIRLLALVLCLTALSACETAKGLGRDIENTGDAIQGAASNVQQAL
ncbi:MAG: entericidin A/B family lipoprotein [Pseudomonadota bacterium]